MSQPDAWDKAAEKVDTDAVIAEWGYAPMWAVPTGDDIESNTETGERQ